MATHTPQDVVAPADEPADFSAVDYNENEDTRRWLRQAVQFVREYYAEHDRPPANAEIAAVLAETQSTGEGRIRQIGLSNRDIYELAGVPWRTDMIAELVHDYLDSVGSDCTIVVTSRLKRSCERYGPREIGEGLRTLRLDKDGCTDREAVGELTVERPEANGCKWIVDRRDAGEGEDGA